jgi:crotonobetainyl-CoA:carnitine CoA-transferase CaiB-like acyl-CoA transferase
MNSARGALAGIRVIDLSRYIAGPYAAMLMADHGADVIKVEKPDGGEETRQQKPQYRDESLYFMTFNRGKRGVALDLRQESGRDTLRKLAGSADVLIESFKPGTMERMELGWPALHVLNPALVVARVSGFGQNGPYSPRPCFDPIAQAMSGLMEQNGESAGAPLMSGTFIADYGTALYTLSGILMALHHRRETGEGQLVDCALLDSAVTFLATSIPEYLLLGQTPARRGNRSRYVAPNECFPTRDGHYVYVVAGHQASFVSLARLMGREDLLACPKFAEQGVRFEHYDEICAVVADWTRTLDMNALLEALEAAGIPAGKVSSIGELARDPQIQAREMIVEVEHPTAGRVPMQGINIKLSGTPGAIQRPPPLLGQHTNEVLEEWLSPPKEYP